MSRVRGRSFKITKNQAKGYGYAKFRRNPGVTTIAAINGRGSYGANRSARSVMSKLKQNARKPVARRRLTAAQKAAFKARMAKGHMSANRSTTRTQSATSRKNIKKAQSARRSWGQKLKRGKRVRVGRAAYGRRPKAKRLSAGVYIANRRKKAGSKTMARRRKVAKATKKRRISKRRRKSTAKKVTSAPKRKRRRKSRKGAARRKTAATKTVRRKRRRSTRKLKANGRRRRRSLRKNAAAPKRKRRRAKSRRKTTSRRRKTTSRKRRSSRRRSTRKTKSSSRRRRGRKLKANGRKRRSSRRRGGLKANRRRRGHRKNGRKSLKSNRRRHRRNGRKLFKMNGVGDVLKTGLVLFGGFALHRLLTNLFDSKVLTRLLPAPAPVATSGFGLAENRGLISSIVVGALGSFAASKLIKNQETRKLVIGGMVASTMHGVVLSLMKSFMPEHAQMLAGPEDGTAARLAAMYGLGSGASIMPRYAPIGMGEYFREPMNGLGEYFREPMNGLGEYIAATNGLGTYEQNGDLFQAAAGMGSHDYQGNHIDPSSDLDRQLTIAEAAAGVGAVQPFEAAAGLMQAAAGFGAIDTVPSADTWIPGSADGQLWAGVRAINNSQSATEMVPAGTLQSSGGQGIFG